MPGPWPVQRSQNLWAGVCLKSSQIQSESGITGLQSSHTHPPGLLHIVPFHFPSIKCHSFLSSLSMSLIAFTMQLQIHLSSEHCVIHALDYAPRSAWSSLYFPVLLFYLNLLTSEIYVNFLYSLCVFCFPSLCRIFLWEKVGRPLWAGFAHWVTVPPRCFWLQRALYEWLWPADSRRARWLLPAACVGVSSCGISAWIIELLTWLSNSKF